MVWALRPILGQQEPCHSTWLWKWLNDFLDKTENMSFHQVEGDQIQRLNYREHLQYFARTVFALWESLLLYSVRKANISHISMKRRKKNIDVESHRFTLCKLKTIPMCLFGKGWNVREQPLWCHYEANHHKYKDQGCGKDVIKSNELQREQKSQQDLFWLLIK